VAHLARLICAELGVTLAVWLLPASIHIVDWTADGPVRVALLPPLWQLWLDPVPEGLNGTLRKVLESSFR
jgi:hypothetical protein